MHSQHKSTAGHCGCSSKAQAKLIPMFTKMTAAPKIAAARQQGPHPVSCCSTTAPLAASACCSTEKVSEHSHQESSCCATSQVEGDPGAEEDPSSLVAPSGTTQYSWQVVGMDCASCARKIEKAVSTLPEVKQAKVLFATEKLLVSASRDISPQIKQAVTSAGFQLLEGLPAKPAETSFISHLKENAAIIALLVLMVISWGIEQISHEGGKIAFTLTTLVALYPVLRQAIRLIRSGSPFAIETLMSIAALGALFIGATAEAAMVLLLFMVGERLEGFAANRARSGVKALMALIPESAVRIDANGSQTVAVSSLQPGDVIEVAAGGRLPADSTLLDSAASFDESALTGESIPVERQPGEKIPAGSLCVDRLARLQVVSAAGNSAIDRVLQLIEEAEERRAPIERFLDTFSRYYTPAIMLLSLLVIIIPPLAMGLSWETWIYRGLTLLLIGCPCALVISTPAAIASGLAAATRQGALIKGGAALEQLALIQRVALDKTGTLTEGKPEVSDVLTAKNISEQQLLTQAAAVEAGSHHPLALAIIQRASQQYSLLPNADRRRALAGVGVEGWVNEKHIVVSAPQHFDKKQLSAVFKTKIAEWEASGKTVVVVLEEQQVIGLLALQDRLRDDAVKALAALKDLGIAAVMLTGDNPRAAKTIAERLGINYQAGLLPEDKVRAVEKMNQQYPTAMVGDGINDAPAMKAATIGIAMGSGTDVALETADAALNHNRLTGLAQMIALSRATRANIRQNITIALGLKGIFLVTTLLGITGLWLAVLADSGATALVTANALRLLRKKSSE